MLTDICGRALICRNSGCGRGRDSGYVRNDAENPDRHRAAESASAATSPAVVVRTMTMARRGEGAS